MEPYYEDDFSALYLADARDVLQEFSKESLNLVVTDPPYGVEWVSNTRAESFNPIVNDRPEDRGVVAEILRECVRLVGQNRHLYVFGPASLLDGLKVSEPVELIWDKATLGSGDMTAAWGPQHERINFAVSKYRHAGQAGKPTVPARLRKGSILRYPRPTGRKVRHPSEKPVGLLQELVESSSRQGEVVLDPFAGVGSTGVAATLSGRTSLLIECEERFAVIAVERLRHAAALRHEVEAA